MTRFLPCVFATLLATGAGAAALAAPGAAPGSAHPAAPAAPSASQAGVALTSAPVTGLDRKIEAQMTRGMVLADVQHLWRQESGLPARSAQD